MMFFSIIFFTCPENPVVTRVFGLSDPDLYKIILFVQNNSPSENIFCMGENRNFVRFAVGYAQIKKECRGIPFYI